MRKAKHLLKYQSLKAPKINDSAIFFQNTLRHYHPKYEAHSHLIYIPGNLQVNTFSFVPPRRSFHVTMSGLMLPGSEDGEGENVPGFLEAMQEISKENYEKGLEMMNACIKYAQDHNIQTCSLYSTRANALMQLGFFDEAIKDFTNAINTSADDSIMNQGMYMLLSLRATCFKSMRMFKEALEDLNQAISVIKSKKPPLEQYARVLYERAKVLYELKQYQDALRDFDKCSLKIEKLIKRGEELSYFDKDTILNEIQHDVTRIKEKLGATGK